ncbi:uncharacterized protein LOC144132323 isoform X6 [Amblyomma americanum]
MGTFVKGAQRLALPSSPSKPPPRWYPAFAEIMGMETAPLKQCGTGRLKEGSVQVEMVTSICQ